MTENEGRLKALIEITETRIADLAEKSEELSQANVQLRQAAREVEELRGLVGDLAEMVDRNRTITWLTTTQLAAELQVHENTVRNWYEAGDLPGYRIGQGGHIRFDREEVRELIKSKNLKGDESGNRKDREIAVQ